MTTQEATVIALRHYRTKWFGLEWAAVETAWQTEYNAVAAGAFADRLFTASAMEGGGNATAVRNFEQAARVAALMTYRADKDADYASEVFGAMPDAAAAPSVMYPVFPSSFAH